MHLFGWKTIQQHQRRSVTNNKKLWSKLQTQSLSAHTKKGIKEWMMTMKILSVRKSMELVPALRKLINDEGQTLGSSKTKSLIGGDIFALVPA
mmetsp:Transcript_22758/g.29167  ORF Transcript_22758/g.29167 Transcript_22758/m.29167 type:complete len:93 (+) Transcript_22758:2420-2698(+)